MSERDTPTVMSTLTVVSITLDAEAKERDVRFPALPSPIEAPRVRIEQNTDLRLADMSNPNPEDAFAVNT